MYSFILLAGGKGSRINSKIPKQFLLLAGKPIIMHTLERIDLLKNIDEIIIVCNKDYIVFTQKLIDDYKLHKKYIIVEGGVSRQSSVYNGLIAANNENVVLHEAARPFVKSCEFEKLMAFNSENCTYADDVNYTVVLGDQIIRSILHRNEVLNIQLPQKFNKKKLLLAHEDAIKNKTFYTDDTTLLFDLYSEKINIIKGSIFNIKITNDFDYLISEKIYKHYILGDE